MTLDTVRYAETPEGIELALRPAGLVARAGAFAIDMAIRIGIYVTAATALAYLKQLGGGVLLVVLFGLEWFYPVVFELGMSGATPGKRALGLQVTMDSGLPVTPAASLVRNLLRTVDFLPALYLVGIGCILGRTDARRLGDLAAGTLVVYAESPRSTGAIPPATPLAPAMPLDARQQSAIVTWAARTPRLTPERAEELARMAAPAAPRQGDAPLAQRLLGVAHWALGRRGDAA